MSLNPFSHRGLNSFSSNYDRFKHVDNRYEDLCRHERDLIMRQIVKEYKNTPLKNDQIPFHDFCSEHRLWERYCLVTNRLKRAIVDAKPSLNRLKR